MNHAEGMTRAIAVAIRNAKAPFGAVLFDPDDELSMIEGLNRSSENPTLHGEIDAINRYAETGRERWSHLTLYTTAEPCCMCQAAILWAGIPTVVFGTSIRTLTELGWNQFRLTAKDISAAADFADCEIIGGVLEAECDSLFEAAKR